MSALIEVSNYFFWIPEALIALTLWNKFSANV